MMKKLRFFNIILIFVTWLSLSGFAPLAQSHVNVAPIAPAAPSAFDKVSPLNGAANQPTKGLTLTWSASANATGYLYCISNKPRCPGNSKKWQTAGNVTTITVPNDVLFPNMVYYWQVRAIDRSNNITEANNGVWWRFKTQPIAGPFVKISPADQAIDQPATSINLQWGASANATGYQYCLYTGATNPCGSLNWVSVGNVTNVTVYNLAANSAYHWQVRAVNGSSTVMADGGTYWQFTTAINPPSAFSKLSPQNNDASEPLDLHLTWSPSDGASSYDYCVDVSENCATGWKTVDASVTSVVPLGLTYNTTYYWQVRARNAQGTVDANSGNWWRFTTIVALPDTFSKISPIDGADNQLRDPWLYWSASGGAASYDYCLAQSTGTNCDRGNLWKPAGSETSFQLHNLTSSTTYYWRIRANNSSGTVEANSGGWWSFTTMPVPPTSMDQSFTANEDTLFGGQLTASAADLTFVVYEQDPAGLLDLNPDGSFTYMPPENYSGVITFQFTVSDGYNAPVGPYTATITVNPVNDPPVIVPLPNMRVVSGDNISFTVTYTDPDIPYGDTLTFLMPANLPSDATFDTTSGDFIWDPLWSNTQSNTYAITFVVKDSSGATAQQTVHIMVDPLKVFLPTAIR